MTQKVKIAGVWKDAIPYVNIAGSWKLPKSIYNRISGSWISSFLQSGIVDEGFSSFSRRYFSDTAQSIAIQPDGKLVVGGYFLTCNFITVGGIVRLNSDGTRDTAFNINTGTGASVSVGNGIEKVLIQPDGKIVLGGNFTTWNGTTVGRIVRLNSDGTRDTAFSTSIGTGAVSNIYEMAIQSDGKIIVGGAFTTWNGTTANRIVRLNSDGTRDTTFTTNTGTAASSSNVNGIEIQPDGKIIVVGGFVAWNGTTVNGIVRLNSDGTRDTAFTTNTGTGGTGASEIAIQSDGKIILGGVFTTWNGVTVNRIVRLNSDGTRDTTFTTNIGTGPTGGNTIAMVELMPNDSVLVAGTFTTWNGVTVNRIVRLNSDGTRDTAFTTNTGTAYTSGNPTSIVIQPTDNIILVGSFGSFNGSSANRIVRILPNGQKDESVFIYTKGANSNTTNAVVQTDNKIVLIGTFTLWGASSLNRIVRLNSDGTRDTAFATNIGTGFNSNPTAVALQSDGKIIVGANGTFNSAVVNGIVRLNSDGTRDTAFTTNIGTGGGGFATNAIAIQSDGKIIVGGAFTTWNGTTVNRIVRLHSDGTRDTTFTTNTGTGASDAVNAIAIQSDGKIVLAGVFTTWNGVTVNRIVRLNSDGTRDTAFTTNTGTASIGTTNSLALQSDGKIIVGGVFSTWNGVTVNRIVRLNSDGTRDTAFTTNTGTAASGGILSIKIQSDGKIILAGAFLTWNGTTVNCIVRLNSDGTRDTAFTTNAGTAAPDGISAIELQSDSKIIIMGALLTFNNIDVGYIARIGGDITG